VQLGRGVYYLRDARGTTRDYVTACAAGRAGRERGVAFNKNVRGTTIHLLVPSE